MATEFWDSSPFVEEDVFMKNQWHSYGVSDNKFKNGNE